MKNIFKQSGIYNKKHLITATCTLHDSSFERLLQWRIRHLYVHYLSSTRSYQTDWEGWSQQMIWWQRCTYLTCIQSKMYIHRKCNSCATSESSHKAHNRNKITFRYLTVSIFSNNTPAPNWNKSDRWYIGLLNYIQIIFSCQGIFIHVMIPQLLAYRNWWRSICYSHNLINCHMLVVGHKFTF